MPCRRDFTINALFYDPISKTTHDWIGGEKDLKRANHPHDRQTRRTLWRRPSALAPRHPVRRAIGFRDRTGNIRRVKALAPKIKLISAERIRDELIKLFRPPYAARGLDLLRESGLMEHVLPELDRHDYLRPIAQLSSRGQRVQSHPPHARAIAAGRPESLPWSVIFHDIGKPPTATVDRKERRHPFLRPRKNRRGHVAGNPQSPALSQKRNR